MPTNRFVTFDGTMATPHGIPSHSLTSIPYDNFLPAAFLRLDDQQEPLFTSTAPDSEEISRHMLNLESLMTLQSGCTLCTQSAAEVIVGVTAFVR